MQKEISSTSNGGKKAAASIRILETLQSFDTLADSANVRVTSAAAIMGCSVDTVWRWAKEKRLNAKKLGPKITVFNVGEIRRLLSGEA